MSVDSWAPRNDTVYRSLMAFVKAAFAVLAEYADSAQSAVYEARNRVSLQDDGSYRIESRLMLNWRVALPMNETALRGQPEFTECVSAIAADTDVLHHTSAGLSREEYLGNQFVIGFVAALGGRMELPEFDNTAFNELYKEAEGVLYSSALVFAAWSELRNFGMEVELLPLTANLRIRRLSRSEQERRLEGTLDPFSSDSIPEALRNPFIIETEETTSEGSVRVVPVEAVNGVVSALRLFKGGGVGSGSVHHRVKYWHPSPMAAGMVTAPASIGRFVGPPYSLAEEEARQFAAFFEWLSGIDMSGESGLQLAVRRFNSAYERARDDDRLIDMMIAFEALLLRERDELSFRLALRTANLLRDVKGRQETFDIMREAYDLRSDIAHGKGAAPEALRSIITSIEELLRWSIHALLAAVGRGDRLSAIVGQLDGAMFSD